MVTKRARWPDPKTGLIIDRSEDLGPGGSGHGSGSRSVRTLDEAVAPDVKGLGKWVDATGRGPSGPMTVVVRPAKPK